MSRQQLIDQVSQLLTELPEAQAAAVLDFAASLHQRHAAPLPDAVQQPQLHHLLTADSFAFLHDEAEDVYTLADVKFHYHLPPADAAE